MPAATARPGRRAGPRRVLARSRYGRELEGGIARDLVARGWAAWNIEYRRLGGDGGWPHTFDDVRGGDRRAR